MIVPLRLIVRFGAGGVDFRLFLKTDRQSPFLLARRFYAIMTRMATDPVIKPTTDLFIAALWSAPKNEPILRSLLNAVMTDIGQPPVVSATVLNPFNVQEYPTDKQIRLDVRVEDEAKRNYIVEVQTETHTGFYNRMLYYWAETYGSLLERGNDYDKLRPVRSIVITEFSVFPELKGLHTVFEVRARENPAVLLSEHLQIHFLRLGNWDRRDTDLEQLCRDLRGWLRFWAFGSKLESDKMSAMLQDVPEVQAAYDEYRRFTADPVMREKVKARERFLIDQRLDRAEALAEGEAKGRMEEKIATARNLKSEGLDPAFIVRMTGLPLSAIERLD